MSVSIINKQIEEKASLQKSFLKTANMLFGKEWDELTKEELYQTLVNTIRQYVSENWIMTNKYYAEHNCKEVYYFSIEFLLGRLLNSNLINLDMKDICKDALADLGIDINELFKQEPDAGLVMAVLADLQLALLILWLHWVFQAMVVLSVINMACSNKKL